MKLIKTLLVLTILTITVMSGGISNRNQTLAAEYRCTTTTCPGQAQCSGDHWTQTGNCAISCYKDSGAPGQIVLNGSANCSPPPSGGGGSGGGLHLIAPTIIGDGTLSARGGNRQPSNTPSGAIGRIRLDAFQQNFSGTSTPPASLGSPYNVPLPSGVPALRIVSINGVSVPASPGGSSSIPDITINTPNPIPIVIEARNVPLGTIVKVNIFSDASGESIIDSTPLAGTLPLSTATATISPQPGFTRLSVRAVWVP